LNSILLALIALLAGTFIGTVGVGGILLIPAFIFFAGINTHEASATALFTFLFTGVLGAYLFQKKGSIHWRATLPVCLGAIIFSYIGAETNIRIEETLLRGIIGILVIIAGLFALRAPPKKDQQSANQFQLTPKNFVLLFMVGVLAGFGSGLSGAGGPLFSVPLMLAFKFNPLLTIGASQVLQIISAGSGSIANFTNDVIRFDWAFYILIFELIGIYLGVQIAHRVSLDILRKIAAYLCITVGLYMASYLI
jgi:uncharacterized membrane protein YfcA